MTNIKRFFFPKKLQDDELFKKFLEAFEEFPLEYEIQFVDIEAKYANEGNIPQEAVDEILKEFGLENVARLLAVSPVIDPYSVLAYASAISLLKGTEVGYTLVLDLLNFDYTIVPWHEQSPKGKFHTFSFDVRLDASVTNQPYETFQRIKRFTRDYVLPVIDPLGYTYNVPINGPVITLKGAAHPIYYTTATDEVEKPLLYGPSNYLLTDENGDFWVVKVNTDGELKAFRANRPQQNLVYFSSIIAEDYEIKVNSSGVLFAEVTVPLEPTRSFLVLMSYDRKDWYVYIDENGQIRTANPFTLDFALTTEDGVSLSQENGFLIKSSDFTYS
jgi:hypothetical protein